MRWVGRSLSEGFPAGGMGFCYDIGSVLGYGNVCRKPVEETLRRVFEFSSCGDAETVSGRATRTGRNIAMLFKRLKLTKTSRQISPDLYLTDRLPKGMPLGEWKTVRKPIWTIWLASVPIWAFAVVSLMMLLHWGGIVLLNSVPTSGSMCLMSIPAAMGAIYLCFVPGIRERRFWRSVISLQYEVCLKCGYKLIGLPDIGRCPECGSQYDKAQLREDWQSWLERA